MAFYDFLLPNTVSRHTRRVADRDAQAEDREASAAWLAEQGTPESLLGLCARFGLQLEHGLKDRKEKDAVIDLLVEHGAKGAAAARQYSTRHPNFQNAIRVVERVEGEKAALDILLEMLAAERVEEEFKIEKKRNLIITLAEHKDPRIVEAAARFLADYDEGVRNGAVEALAAQEGETPREPLWGALTNKREESTRIRGRLAEIFAARRWNVPADEWFPAHVPQGYRLQAGRLIGER